VRIIYYDWDSIEGHMAQGCGYVLADMGTERLWLIFCPFYIPSEQEPYLVY
jgi:hypothetical protein